MENYKLFIVKVSSSRKYFLIDVAMDDELHTHRYYFLVYTSKEDYKYLRIRNVDSLLHLLQKDGITIADFDNMTETDTSYTGDNYAGNFALEKLNEANSPFLAELENYDTKVLEKLFKGINFEEQRSSNLK